IYRGNTRKHDVLVVTELQVEIQPGALRIAAIPTVVELHVRENRITELLGVEPLVGVVVERTVRDGDVGQGAATRLILIGVPSLPRVVIEARIAHGDVTRACRRPQL